MNNKILTDQERTLNNLKKLPRYKYDQVLKNLEPLKAEYGDNIPLEIVKKEMKNVKTAPGKMAMALARGVIGAPGDFADLLGMGVAGLTAGAAKAIGLKKDFNISDYNMNLGEKSRKVLDYATNDRSVPESMPDRLAQNIGEAFGGFGVWKKAGQRLAKAVANPQATQTFLRKAAEKTSRFLGAEQPLNRGMAGALTGGATAHTLYHEAGFTDPIGDIIVSGIGGYKGGKHADKFLPSKEQAKHYMSNPADFAVDAFDTAINLPKNVSEGVKNTMASAVSKWHKVNPEKYEKMKDLGVTDLSLISDSPSAAQAIESVGQNPLTAAQAAILHQENKGNILRNFGIDDPTTALTPNHDAATIAATQAKKKISDEYGRMIEPVNQVLEQGGSNFDFVDTDNILSGLQNLYKKLYNPNFPSAMEAFKKTEAGKLHSHLLGSHNKLMSKENLTGALMDAAKKSGKTLTKENASAFASEFLKMKKNGTLGNFENSPSAKVLNLFISPEEMAQNKSLGAFFGDNKKITLGELSKVQQDIKEKLRNSKLTASERGDLKNADSLISTEIENYLNTVDPTGSLSKQMKDANTYYAQHAQDKAFTSFDPETGLPTTRESVGVLSAAQNIETQGKSNLGNFETIFEKKDPTHYKMVEMGLSQPERKKFATDLIMHAGLEPNGDIDFNKIYRWWNNHNDKGKKAFFDMAGWDPQKIEKFGRTIDSIHENKALYAKYGNKSGSGHKTEYYRLINLPWEAVKLAGALKFGAAFEYIVVQGANIFGKKKYGELLLDPTFHERMAKVAKSRNATEYNNNVKHAWQTPILKKFNNEVKNILKKDW